MGYFSPQCDDYLSGSNLSNKFDKLGGFSSHFTNSSNENVHFQSCSIVKMESSIIKDSSETIVPDKDYTSLPMTSRSEALTNSTMQKNSMVDGELLHGTCNEILAADLLCAGCKQLIYRPVVLNWGHVYCEGCVIKPSSKVYKCEICQSVLPNMSPKVCLVLEHSLEEHFAEEYTARKAAVQKQADCLCGSPSTNSTQAHPLVAASSTIMPDYCEYLRSGRGPKIHIGAGNDSCGMYPLTGEQYKCEDCAEEIGFDLCEVCYKNSSRLTGRFNQQHTPEHKFKIVQPRTLFDLIVGLNAPPLPPTLVPADVLL